MKKIITLLITLTIIFSLVGCNSQEKLNEYDINILLNGNQIECDMTI